MQEKLFLSISDLKLGRCRYGWMLYSGYYIGKCLEVYGEYSESEVSVFRMYLKEGDFAIDVGANIGDLTLPLSRLVGESGRVFAYESNPETYNILCANLALNSIKNTKPFNAFVADNPKTETSSPVWGKHAFIGETWEPTFSPLDSLQLDRLDFLKVDVDGNELSVLRSGENLLKKYKPVLYFENDLRDRSPSLFNFVLSLGYRLFFHYAPIFQPNNYYANPNNVFDRNICSLMMLAVPPHVQTPDNLREVQNIYDWWE